MTPSRKKTDGDGRRRTPRDGRGAKRKNDGQEVGEQALGESTLHLQDAAPESVNAPAVPYPVACIGASAGGLEAFTQLLAALPNDTGMAFVLVSHLSPSHDSRLAEILSRATPMPVREATDAAMVQPNCVYVIPPDTGMVIARGALTLVPRIHVRGQHHPIDQFLESLAVDQGHQSIGVILSGTGSDGTLGLDEIKAAGGITFAQDQSAAYDGMPRSAALAGAVDFVLPPAEIAHKLSEIARHAYAAPGPSAEASLTAAPHYTKIMDALHQSTGVDFRDYKVSTLSRRIARRMALHKIDEVADYAQVLASRPGEIGALFQDILINVTSFFRDQEAFELLKTKVFPRITAEGVSDVIRMWVVGCATGEEAYSIAIMFSEYMEREGRVWPVQIFATDLNPLAVERARVGVYPKSIAERVSSERLRRHFVEIDGKYRVAKPIRDMCVFAKHNVAADPPFSRMDLITCRNLLIYLQPALQHQLMPILHYALRPTGFLWLGASETTGTFRELFEPEDSKHRFYTKRPTTTRVQVPVLLRRSPDERRTTEVSLVPGRREDDAQREADRILLARYTPPGVLVTEELEILQFRGDTGAYLAPAAGRASLSLAKMLREGLLVPVRSLITRAKRDGAAVRKEGVRVKSNDELRLVDLEVVPVRLPRTNRECYLLLFHEPEAQPTPAPARAAVEQTDLEVEEEMRQLRQELTATKDYLQSVIEQQEAASEELQSANEEVQSTNEELQSINEEIETSKEEIQSSNEELSTVNEELQTRNAELGQSNNDLMNLLASVQMAIVMIGRDLRIRRFTPMAEKMLNLIASDVGRPITDIKLNVDVPDLDTILAEVIDTVQPYQRDVQDKTGRWYSMRARPYRTLDSRIDGAVIVLVDIDAVKATAETLRVSAERLLIMYDRAPLGIFETDLDGRFLRVNDRFSELTGRPRETLLALRSQDITHPDDLAADLETFDRIRTGAIPAARREKRYLREDGREVWVELHRFGVPDSQGHPTFTVGIAEDITERKETETQLRRREARFRALMNAAPALIWASGLEGMDYINQAYLEFLGVESHEVLGNAWMYFIHPDDRDGYADAYDNAMSGLRPFEHQFRFRRGDGEYRWMMTVALPQFGAAGKFGGFTGATFDITALKQAEVSLRSADQRKDEFIAMLAHELRNPLAPITNVVQILKAKAVDASTERWAHEVLDRQLRNVGRMVNDLLDVSRVSHGKILLQPERIELSDLVSRSIDALRPAIEAGKKRFAVELPATPVVLYADPVRLEQILGNLVHNAVKFTPPRGHIWVTASVDQGERTVSISVRDDGDGIAPDALARVFDMFVQGNSSMERAQGGLGIGLTLVRGLVELHGGTIEARSDGPGNGSEFMVTLPLEDVPPDAKRPEPTPRGAVARQRILIVDDNVDAANALAALLRQDEHTVEAAHSGAAALDLAAAFRPQVALIDLGMPGMNGFMVAERLRATQDGLVLVAVSGYSGEESRRRARDAGFDEYVIKPLDPQVLDEMLSRRSR